MFGFGKPKGQQAFEKLMRGKHEEHMQSYRRCELLRQDRICLGQRYVRIIDDIVARYWPTSDKQEDLFRAFLSIRMACLHSDAVEYNKHEPNKLGPGATVREIQSAVQELIDMEFVDVDDFFKKFTAKSRFCQVYGQSLGEGFAANGLALPKDTPEMLAAIGLFALTISDFPKAIPDLRYTEGREFYNAPIPDTFYERMWWCYYHTMVSCFPNDPEMKTAFYQYFDMSGPAFSFEEYQRRANYIRW